jgi:transcription elongation factor GreA
MPISLPSIMSSSSSQSRRSCRFRRYALSGFFAEHNCRLLQQAAKSTDLEGGRHLMRLLERNQGLKPRLKEKLEEVILRVHPGALSQARAEAPAAETAQPIYMTAAGIEKLRREHDRIVHEEMPANAAEIQRAREFGDLSENAEYHAAREKQSLLQARSDLLKGQIALAREIKPEIVRTDAVSVGSRVRLRDAAGQEVTYTLLGPADVDVDNHVINYQTPLGRSLMGRKRGETVTLEVMGDTHTYQVLDIACGV